MPWPLTGAIHYHAQVGLADKGRAIEVLVVCYAVWLGSMGWDLDHRFIHFTLVTGTRY